MDGMKPKMSPEAQKAHDACERERKKRTGEMHGDAKGDMGGKPKG